MAVNQALTEDVAVERHHLTDLPVVCAIHRDDPLASHEVIVPQDLHGRDFIALAERDNISRQFDAAMLKHGAEVITRTSAWLASSVATLVSEGLGVGLIDAETVFYNRPPNVVCRPFESSLKLPLCIFHSADRPLSLALTQLRDHLFQLAPEYDLAKLD